MKTLLIALLVAACAVGGAVYASHTMRGNSSSVNGGAAVPPERILVAYYSWSGNTRSVAEQIAQQTGGKLLEITCKEPYPADYQACTEKAESDIRAGVTPAINHEPVDWSQYDLVFIGSPNWWSTIATPVSAFLKEAPLKGKKTALFITHGGGGIAHTERDAKALLKGADFLGALALRDRDLAQAEPTITAWVKQILGEKK